MSSPESKLASAKTLMSTAASLAATAAVVRSIANDFLPYEIQHYLFSGIRNFFNRFSSQITLVIDEFDGLVNNQIYGAADLYLGSKVSPATHRLKVTKPENEKNIVVTMERDQEIVDVFDGVKFRWILICTQAHSRSFYNPHDINSTLKSEVRSYHLSFNKKHKEKALNSYLPHIVRQTRATKQQNKALKIFTFDQDNMYGNLAEAWKPVNLDHPATFETLAMKSELKQMVLEDLERFVKRKQYYRKVGKAWKRGYLLYGPPGTGKSSLIAAMANYLKFDIYDLELTELRCNSDLRRVLIATKNRSILVVEDIDCTIELQDRLAEASACPTAGFYPENKVTLSGLLNFIDGLWSSCGDERIIVFTTNHREKLDPALLRPGRMDVHIHMSYCTPCGFRLLATNYLGINDHVMFGVIEDFIQATDVTPAEVAEQLMKSEELDVTLGGLVEFLKLKRIENEKAKTKKAAAAQESGEIEVDSEDVKNPEQGKVS